MSHAIALQQSYSDEAAHYDEKRFSGPAGQHLAETDRRILRTLVGLSGARNIIDVPVGTGRVLDYLKGMDVDVTGVDLTEEMLDCARRVADPERHTLMQGDASNLPFPDGSFDALISLRFFHLFPTGQRAAFTREFMRLVRPGGHFIVSYTNGWYAGGLNWLKKAIGLQTVHFESFGEVQQLFPGCRVVRCFGNFLPRQRTVERVPGIGPLCRAATERFPLNLFCWEKYYLLQKPEQGA